MLELTKPFVRAALNLPVRRPTLKFSGKVISSGSRLGPGGDRTGGEGMRENTNAEVLQQWRIRHAYHLNLYGTFVSDPEGNKLKPFAKLMVHACHVRARTSGKLRSPASLTDIANEHRPACSRVRPTRETTS
jgi:hypothetical protein